MSDIPDAIFRFVEHELYNYQSTKEDLKDMKEDIAESSLGNLDYDDFSSNKGYPGSTTEATVTDIITNKAIIRATKTIRDIEEAKNKLDEDKLKLFHLKYNNRMPWQQITMEIGISESTYFRWREEIVRETAKEMGLIT